MTPPAVENPDVYLARSANLLLPRDVDWLEGTADRRRAFPEAKVAPIATTAS